MIGGALAGFGWWMLRRRTEVPPLTETILNHGPIPRLTMTMMPRFKCSSSAQAHHWAARCSPPIRRCPWRSRHIPVGTDAA